MTRREAREQALCMVFEKMFHDEPLPEVIDLAKEARTFDPSPFAKQLATGVCIHSDEIDEKIEKYSIGWSKKRISKVVLSVLRLSIYEIIFEKNIPASVSINEAIELTKKYGGEGDSSFVNGILGTFVRKEKADANDDKGHKAEEVD